MVDLDSFYIYAYRPDALSIWSNREVRERLSWYYQVMKNEKPAKYLIAKRVPVADSRLSSMDLDSLWDLHREARREFERIREEVRRGASLEEYPRPEVSFLDLKAEIVGRMLRSCNFCERRCGVDRAAGKRGFCGLNSETRVASAFLHMGEEAPLVPSGTIFFSGCSFKCVYCIDEDEYILAKVDGLANVLRLKDVYSLFNRGAVIEVLTPNGWRRVSDIISRRGEVYEIETSRGKKVRLTSEHIVICHGPEGFREVQAGELKEGDRLVTMADNGGIGQYVNNGGVKEINLVEEFYRRLDDGLIAKIRVKGVKPVIEKVLKRDNISLKEFMERAGVRNYKHWMLHYDSIPLEIFMKLYSCYGDIRENIDKYYISMKGVKYRLPAVLKVSAPLMRLLGYFVADGSYSGSHGLVLTNSNPDLLKDVIKCVKSVIPSVNSRLLYEYRGKTPQVVLSSKLLYLLFKYVFEVGDKAYGKQIPWIAYNTDVGLLREFLSAYASGNGTITINEGKKDYYVRFVTTSEKIRYGLVYLLQLHGIQCRVKRVRVDNKLPTGHKSIRDQFWIEVEGIHNLSKLTNILDFVDRKRRSRLIEALNNAVKVKRNVKGDYVKSIRKVGSNKRVFDIVIDGKDESLEEHTFYAGDGILIHNCQNWDISSDPFSGAPVNAKQLALIATDLRKRGARNINYVGGNPDQHLHTIVESLKYMDINVPLLWNSNFYFTMETLEILVDLIDIWLPDFKYGNDECAFKYSRVRRYFEVVSRNHKVLHDRGEEMIIRHLVLPGHLECCTKPVLRWIAENVPRALVNVMDQYRPEFRVLKEPERFKEIARRPTRSEILEAYEEAERLGLLYKPIS